jgi:hypothetical protein
MALLAHGWPRKVMVPAAAASQDAAAAAAVAQAGSGVATASTEDAAQLIEEEYYLPGGFAFYRTVWQHCQHHWHQQVLPPCILIVGDGFNHCIAKAHRTLFQQLRCHSAMYVSVLTPQAPQAS